MQLESPTSLLQSPGGLDFAQPSAGTVSHTHPADVLQAMHTVLSMQLCAKQAHEKSTLPSRRFRSPDIHNLLAHHSITVLSTKPAVPAGAQGMDRRKDMGLPTSAFPLDLPSPGLMPLPDASQQPQHVAGPSGEPLHPAVHPFYPAVHLQHGPC